MGQALYRKHRPKSLNAVVGQEHITKTLEQAIKTGKIRHAYLFTGPRGVGKTSIARILAHAINELDYADDTPHIDIIEIDAASNRRIDEIRDLRDKVAVAPVIAKYKVYIIDEVHMLTREAFNALLKTLEEPPAHVVFILATTDAHKLPDTIISRTQRFSFKPVPVDKVVAHLSAIAKKEKIHISPEALQLLAEHGEGSFRDSISLLDQASNHKDKLEAADVAALLGVPPQKTIDELQMNIEQGASSAKLMQALGALYDQGYQPATIAKVMSQSIRQTAMAKQGQLNARQLQLLAELLEVPVSHDAERYLEIVVLRNRNEGPTPTPLPAARTEPTEDRSSPEDTSTETVATATPESTTEDNTPKKTGAKQDKKAASDSQAFSSDLWPSVLQALKQNYNTLYGVVRMAEPEFTADTLVLRFAFAFHQKRLSEKTNQQILVNILHDLTGQAITLECLLDESAKPLQITSDNQVKSPPDLNAISNIFGGGELLES